ncbi:1-aminocyclopropane-1-carboxylate deaminase/D-cysteine desulfhydrase [Nonlabens xiamenensis]|uniref:1-aminocyclopropane-1-carboxylate deaminase/D-cysteine desulfhydrase n=1 Tax=Nonlabens xiamenensis TaxID=2341043 RepID=UPI000F60617E|nr:pyridoxal-phosphate dependent enzyme [Nonlabens xiamenensis]
MEKLFKQAHQSQNQPYICEVSDQISIKREDLLHPEVAGNKLRKLKYNLQHALDAGRSKIVTFGGAYSNHIAATAAACAMVGMKSIGVIRGEELAVDLQTTLRKNPTLRLAHRFGMELHFIDRTTYRDKMLPKYQLQWEELFGPHYLIPEGGTNQLAVQGCEEILSASDLQQYDLICVAAGTGGTAAGIINTAGAQQKIMVFSALKGDFMRNEIQQYCERTDFKVIQDDQFGGYAKSDDRLIGYMNARFRESGIPLDPIYTGKMMYGIEQMLREGVIPAKTRILAIHTGGLQGIAGYNQMLAQKGRLRINYEDKL